MYISGNVPFGKTSVSYCLCLYQLAQEEIEIDSLKAKETLRTQTLNVCMLFHVTQC